MTNIDPILSNDLNEQYSIRFEFPIPELKVIDYIWEFNAPTFEATTSGTPGALIPVYSDLTEPLFPGFEIRLEGTSGTAGTNVNYVSEIIRDESQLFQSSIPFKNLLEIISIEDTILGDTDVLKVIKEFRFSIDNFNWTDWDTLTKENINTLLNNFQTETFLQFRYNAVDIGIDNYDTEIIVDLPDTIGWNKVHSSTSFYTFDTDFPNKGEIEYSVGFGTNGDYYIKTNPDNSTQIYKEKTGGMWGAPYQLIVTATTSGNTYQPPFVTDEIYNNALTGTFEPLERDYVLSQHDILFGKDEVYTAEHRAPLHDEFIFFNPTFQNIKLTGNETIRINYTPRLIPPTYIPRVYLSDMTIYANQHIFEVEPLSCLENIGDQIVLKPPYLLKVFSLDGFCIEATGITEHRTLDISFRWSNNNKHWSDWFPMTDDNLKCLKADPLSFFYIEIVFTRTGTDTTGEICICDLVLNGDYQNVTNDYSSGKRFGLRGDCDYGSTENGDAIKEDDSDIPVDWIDNEDCPTEPTFNPYDFNRSLNLYEKLANDVSNLFGWEVDYYKTTPDNGGRDMFLHEYQLYNVSAKSSVKVIVPDNQFPENTIMFNQFDLSLFDTFEIHITRKEFHKKFGIGRRPEKRDFIFFCQTNRMYQIEHAQSYREFMNTSIYYKVVLKKYQDRKNINNGDFTDPLKDLLQDNSLDNMFHKIVEDETKKVANKEILENLTERGEEMIEPHIDDDVVIAKGEEPQPFKSIQPVHSEIFATTIRYDLLNGPNLISKNHYDLSSRTENDAVVYKNFDMVFEECDDISIVAWFNITYQTGQVYNILTNYNSILGSGFRIDFIDGIFEILINETIYDFEVSVKENCWYGLVINISQSRHKIELDLFSIKTNPFGSDTGLNHIEEKQLALIPQIIKANESELKIVGSPMKLTNIRFFKTYIPKQEREHLLNQFIIKDTSRLIFADNCEKKVITNSNKF